MEVETQTTLPNFDQQSKTSSFPFTLHVNADSRQLTTYDFSLNFNRDSDHTITEEKLGAHECMSSESLILCANDASLDDLSHNDKSTATISDNEAQSCESTAAVKLQKVYRSYRTRRRLADSAVVAEELWWQALDYARLNHSTISFFNFGKSETAASRWNRIGLNASKVGKGLSRDAKAKKLAFQHWIEAIDPRHRYGHSLHLYYEVWCNADAGQPFFYWLDIGEGRDVDLKECPRSKLRQQCITYLGPQQREHFEYIVVEGKFVHKNSGELLDTVTVSHGAKWIFVMSTFKKFYAGEKKKGIFHHSSFLAGGATLAAGRLIVIDGVLKTISAYSGHYRPTDENLNSLLDFLKENGVNMDQVEVRSSTEDYEYIGDSKSNLGELVGGVHSMARNPSDTKLFLPELPQDVQKDQPTDLDETAQDGSRTNNGRRLSGSHQGPRIEVPKKELLQSIKSMKFAGSYQGPQPSEQDEASQNGSKIIYKRTLSGGLQSPRPEVPRKELLQRIKSKKIAHSYQLGHQLSLKWSTGAGPRIGCMADYPLELRMQALEFVNLSPRTPPTPSSCLLASLVSPTSCATDHCRQGG